MRASHRGKTKCNQESLQTPLLKADAGSRNVPCDTKPVLIDNGSSHIVREKRSVRIGGVELRDSPADVLDECSSDFPGLSTWDSEQLSIHAILSKVARGKGGVRNLNFGGVEAIPVVSGDEVKSAIRSQGFTSFVQFLPRTNTPAILGLGTHSRKGISHRRLAAFLDLAVKELHRHGICANDRVGLAVPNGPELAVCLLACMSAGACVPVNHQQTSAEIHSELLRTRAKALIVQAGEANDGAMAAAGELGLLVLELVPSPTECGIFSLRAVTAADAVATAANGSVGGSAKGRGTGPGDVGLVLHTSGTSGTKKLVPYTLEALVVGAACVAATWELGPSDVCMNMMPLFHVGGIVRNLLAVVMSGGAVVCAGAFDPSLFWDAAEGPLGITWYYAGPTMHQMILEEARSRAEESGVPPRHRVRMVANAAGGLLPTLADSLRRVFGCCVLPSYGMTECMPISSPPSGYALDRPGTSGQIVGPAVRVVGDDGKPLGPGEVGRIAVRGAPVMQGYEGDDDANRVAFLPDPEEQDSEHTGEANVAKSVDYGRGWFDTGDMGKLDADGWIYLTGRSKEVINRGGEIISPFEVEEALISHERIMAVAAFSAPHDTFQEVVGVVIVPDPGRPRPDLYTIHHYAAGRLHPAKWPQVIVYMDALPRGAANKVQRIKLAERLGMRPVSELEPQTHRLFEAICPPAGCGLQTLIPMQPVRVELHEVVSVVSEFAESRGVEDFVVVSRSLPQRRDAVVVYVTPLCADAAGVKACLRPKLHDYIMPMEVVCLESLPNDHSQLPPFLATTPSGDHNSTGVEGGDNGERSGNPKTATERLVQKLWAGVVGVEQDVNSDFFESGGNSLLGGRLIAKIRKALGVPLSAATIFSCRTIASLAAAADALLPTGTSTAAVADANAKSECLETPLLARRRGKATDSDLGGGAASASEGGSMSTTRRAAKSSKSQRWMEPARGQASLIALFFQGLPLMLLYPLRRVSTWILFVAIWVFLQDSWKLHRLDSLVLALAVSRIITEITLPLVGILCKWLIIGKYREGRYPLWGQYYLRWWLVEQLLLLCGRGFFRLSPFMLRLYYGLLGAHIGRGVIIDRRAKLGEFDLISIGAGSLIDRVPVRAFYFDDGAMALRRLVLGENCVICTKVALAPGISVPDGACMGPLSSSYELGSGLAPESNRAFCSACFPKPWWALRAYGRMIIIAVWLASQMPVLLVLRQMVLEPWYKNRLRNYFEVMEWFLTPQRVGYYVAIRVVRNTISPFVRLFCCIIVKRLVVGRFTPGRRDRTQYNLFKHWLMAELAPGERLQDVAHMIGVHYEGVSVILRLLGAKVGRRIYWPGSGLEHLVEYDLFEVGDDVVFGSRSVIMCADRDEALHVKIESGANVADRCVLLPGVTIGRSAVLGSGGLARKRMTLRAGSKWVGSRRGGPVMLDPGFGAGEDGTSTIRPFGRAMYLREAPYWVMPAWMHGLIWTLFQNAAAAYRALTLTASLAGTAAFLESDGDKRSDYTLGIIAARMVPVFLGIQDLATIVAISLAIAGKWMIMGRRRQGRYNWDTSNYCQRWQVYLASTSIIRSAYFGNGILEYLHGSAYLVWYFRALGAHIGRNVCLYPTGADPMMTEPDLVQIGDQACIDDASVIAHINSQGQFSLNSVVVGPRATLRRFSRVLSGAAVMPGGTLLEHTLVLSGDIVDAYSTWQGWPAAMVAAFPSMVSISERQNIEEVTVPADTKDSNSSIKLLAKNGNRDMDWSDVQNLS